MNPIISRKTLAVGVSVTAGWALLTGGGLKLPAAEAVAPLTNTPPPAKSLDLKPPESSETLRSTAFPDSLPVSPLERSRLTILLEPAAGETLQASKPFSFEAIPERERRRIAAMIFQPEPKWGWGSPAKIPGDPRIAERELQSGATLFYIRLGKQRTAGNITK